MTGPITSLIRIPKIENLRSNLRQTKKGRHYGVDMVNY